MRGKLTRDELMSWWVYERWVDERWVDERWVDERWVFRNCYHQIYILLPM